MNIYKVPCEECGETITTKYRNKRFCSTSCTNKAWYRRKKGTPGAAARAGKICLQCKETFTAKRSDAVYCSAFCAQKAWYKANPEKREEYLAQFAERHPDYIKNRLARIKADPERYAILQERKRRYYLNRKNSRHNCDWDEMFAGLWHLQDGKCYLCEESLNPDAYCNIHLDHDHSCCPLGRSCEKCRRGLACQRCNTLIGLVKDDPDYLYRIANNLEIANSLVRKRIAILRVERLKAHDRSFLKAPIRQGFIHRRLQKGMSWVDEAPVVPFAC